MARCGIHGSVERNRTMLWTALGVSSLGALVATTQILAQQTVAPSVASSTATALQQRGAELRAAINAEYHVLRVSKSLTDSIRDANDVTPIVLKFLPAGTPLDDAEGILRGAGCVVQRSDGGRVVARATLQDGLFDRKHLLVIDVARQTPADSAPVAVRSAGIRLMYVPNAGNR